MADLTGRLTTKQTVAVTDALATTEEILFGSPAFGRIHVPTGETVVTLTYYDAPEKGGTYLASNDSTPAAVTQTVSAGNSYPIPETMYGAAAIKIVGDVAGTIIIVRKS